jgi:hypothetical protein
MTIVQLLNTDKYNRNEKIDFINAIMTPSSEKTVNTENIFPGVGGQGYVYRIDVSLTANRAVFEPLRGLEYLRRGG